MKTLLSVRSNGMVRSGVRALPILCFVVLLAGLGVIWAEDKPGQKPDAPQGVKADEPKVQTAGGNVKTDFPVIGYIEKRGKTITIKAGPKGPLYSVKTTEGKVLCEDLSSEQLRAQAPELQEFLKTAVANGSGKSGVTVDASVRPTSAQPVAAASVRR
jgi:hypothetical protein